MTLDIVLINARAIKPTHRIIPVPLPRLKSCTNQQTPTPIIIEPAM
jgi:hypothetical protein